MRQRDAAATAGLVETLGSAYVEYSFPVGFCAAARALQ